MLQDFRLAGFADLPGQKHLVDDTVNLIEVEHQIQFANIVEVFVQHFYKVVYRLEISQVVVAHVHADAEVEAGVAPVDDLEVSELHEIRVLGVPDSHHGVDLFDQFLLLVIVEVHVPLGQAGLAGSVLDEDEPNHF